MLIFNLMRKVFQFITISWNGNQVSGEAEYEELLNKAFDKGRAKSRLKMMIFYDYQEIVNQIIQSLRFA